MTAMKIQPKLLKNLQLFNFALLSEGGLDAANDGCPCLCCKQGVVKRLKFL